MMDYPSLAHFMGVVAREIGELKAKHPGVEAVGIGFPCPVKEGEPRYAPPNLGFELTGIRRELNPRINLPVFAFNDASAAVWGEATYGAGRGFNRVVWHGLGTGYGTAVVDGHAEILADAFEGGHIAVFSPYDSRAVKCGCGRFGCAETMVSGPALAKAYARSTDLNPDDVTGEMVGIAFKDGKRRAIQVVQAAMGYLALAMVTIHNLTFADRHILGGGVAEIGYPLLEMIRNKLKEPGMASWDAGEDLASKTVLSGLGGMAGLVGASVLTEKVLMGG
jgi:glucokinase